jgi:hypothetical protein
VTAVIDTPIGPSENEDRIGSARSLRMIGPVQITSTLSPLFSIIWGYVLMFSMVSRKSGGGYQTNNHPFNQKAKIKNAKQETVARTSSLSERRCETRAV